MRQRSFNPRAPRGARLSFGLVVVVDERFQSTRPARGATRDCRAAAVSSGVSIHAPRAGRDDNRNTLYLALPVSIHAPRAGRDPNSSYCASCQKCFNPRAPRGARQKGDQKSGVFHSVSIHAPRAGRDRPQLIPHEPSRCFNPRAPRGARPRRGPSAGHVSCFNPRAPRGARLPKTSPDCRPGCFNPRAPRGARQRRSERARAGLTVSIHAPRAGRDMVIRCGISAARCFNPRAPRGARLKPTRVDPSKLVFQSTRPARGATLGGRLAEQLADVSIHAPRAGRDVVVLPTISITSSFNPRAPRGARPAEERSAHARLMFQSTRPARGATVAVRCQGGEYGVSIHAPRAGRDSKSKAQTRHNSVFQSTRPARGATLDAAVHQQIPHVSIHAPRAGRDDVAVDRRLKLVVSIHAPRAGRDIRSRASAARCAGFNPRAPRGARRTGVERNVIRLEVSIHAPRAGRDMASWSDKPTSSWFQSTRPARGATGTAADGAQHAYVSIHAPRAGRDLVPYTCPNTFTVFQSTRPARGATARLYSLQNKPQILPISRTRPFTIPLLPAAPPTSRPGRCPHRTNRPARTFHQIPARFTFARPHTISSPWGS